MTLIQTHEKELRAMMERAGIEACDPHKERYYWLVPHDGGHLVFFHDGQSVAVDSIIGFGDDETDAIGARHPDPRIALRACLEMAGLLVDRPPQTDAELIAWLTERWGEPERLPAVTTWDRIRLLHANCHRGNEWVKADGRAVTARELGAILWTADRFPEVKP